jgi:AICAR transformylase/IMP cyclohydrolase PurH
VKSQTEMFRSLLNGVLIQGTDEGNYSEWKEAGGRETTTAEKEDLKFANLSCKHLKSNAIALVKNKQLIGKVADKQVVLIHCANQLKRQSNLILICMALY